MSKTITIKRPAGFGEFKEKKTPTYSGKLNKSKGEKGMKTIVGLMLLVGGLFMVGTPVVKHIMYNVGCEGYLKSAADAPTIELAKVELDIAIAYLDECLTVGSFLSYSKRWSCLWPLVIGLLKIKTL